MNNRRFNSTLRPGKGFKRKSYTWKRSEKPLGFKGRKRLTSRRPSKGKTVDGDSRRAIKDECDQLVREILRLRDGRCVNFGCAQTEGLHVGHYITRKVLALRWHLQNCNLQCDPHNEAHNTNPESYQQAMILRYGIGVTWRLEGIAEENPRLEYVELIKIRDGLRAELKRYEAARKKAA